MYEENYKKYTVQARTSIKGEAFFEALISDYSIPHHIVGSKDIGIDYICEWTYGNKPTGVLFAIQVKTFPKKNVRLRLLDKKQMNGLQKYRISNSNLKIDNRTLQYWKGLGMPIYLTAIIQSESKLKGQSLDCYYKRFTPILTGSTKQEKLDFSKVNNGTSFLAFADPIKKTLGFARDLYIDYMRWSYFKGSISYLPPRVIGLNQFPEKDGVFVDLFKEYKDKVCLTYAKTKGFLEQYCKMSPGS